MRQHIVVTALAAAVSALAFGQNLNPTVEVTNAYEGGASSIAKPAQLMTVPDSVMTFNLDFDYSVFEKPYQGAYEFKPYYVQLKPRPSASTENAFFLRLGAGYTLHPDLTLAWTPFRKEKFRFGVHADHHSYFGRYHRIGVETMEDGSRLFTPTGEKMKGFLSDTRIGMDGNYAWEGGEASLDVSWRQRMADDETLFQKLGGIEARGRVRSLPLEEPHFIYDATVDYHYYGSNRWAGEYSDGFTESMFCLDGSFGPAFSSERRLLVNVDVALVRYGDLTGGYTGGLSLSPKYEFALDDWRFSLGVRLSSLIYSDNWEELHPEWGVHKSGLIFPAVHVDYRLLGDRLVLQAAATGGDRVNSLSDRFFLRPFVVAAPNGHSMERIRAMLGARGNIAGRFRYDFQAGYSRLNNVPLDGFMLLSSSGAGIYPQPYLGEVSFNLLFAQLEYGWKSDHVLVDGKMAYRRAPVSTEGILNPAAFTGSIRPAYRWGDRFKAGIDAAWSTRRTSTFQDTVYAVPGWVDLGLFAEYRFTRNFGFWLKGGNLLNQAIQDMPLHAEAGMYGTAGILLTF
jgi:hypothetical protein